MENLLTKLAGTSMVLGATGFAGTVAWGLVNLEWATHLTSPPAALLISLGLVFAGFVVALWSALIEMWFRRES